MIERKVTKWGIARNGKDWQIAGTRLAADGTHGTTQIFSRQEHQRPALPMSTDPNTNHGRRK